MNPSNPHDQTVKPGDDSPTQNDDQHSQLDTSPVVIQPDANNAQPTQPESTEDTPQFASAETTQETASNQTASSDTADDTKTTAISEQGDTTTVTATPFQSTATEHTVPTESNEQRLQQDATEPSASSTQQFASQPAAPVVTSTKKPKKKLLLAVGLIVLGLLLLAGGVAAAYYGYVVPNKPENILKNATVTTLSAKHLTLDGEMELAGDEGVRAVKALYTAQLDNETNTSATTVKLLVSGVDFTVDARTIDGDMYVRVGDLSTIKSVLLSVYGIAAEGPELDNINTLLDKASTVLSNQWILIDSTLLNQATNGCELPANVAFTEQDLDLLQNEFVKNPFVTINQTTNEVVGEVSTKRFNLTIDHATAEKYSNNLSELSVVKALNECEEATTSEEVVSESILKNDSTELTVWVDTENNRLHKIEIPSLVGNPTGDGEFEVSLVTQMSYETVSVEKPADAMPIMQLVGELQSIFFESQNVLGDSIFLGNSFNGNEQ